MAENEGRPAPEALLEEARKEGRGRLKIFLGAYPGVGKTYAMLQAAQERRREGVDVAVAVVETHGRAETEALLRGLDVLPRRRLTYRGRIVAEMDLDALLWRRPRLAVVDELAHSNVDGCRHVKRHQDVEELLAAGIDVFTTLNVQHVESLNDVVERISGVRVRETLPDKVLELADEIELVDLPPDDLLARLREGKVYVRDQIGRAMQHFFGKGNLTALRELAMRVAAERVDAEMVNYMRAHAIAGPWPAQDRLLVCINESPVGKKLVRAAKRMAERSRMPWIAVNVHTPRSDGLSDAAKDRIAEALRLAESLGAEAFTVHAESDVAGELLTFARSHNVSRILLGRPRRRRLSGWLREHVGRRLLKEGGPFEITMVAPEDAPAADHLIEASAPARRFDLRAFGWATLAVAVAIAISHVADRFLPLANLSLIFLMAVLFAAIRFGLWPSVYTALVSFVAYNFFFTEPYHTFIVSRRADVLTVIFFLVVAVIVGNLAARLKDQVEAMRQTARRTANLYDFSRRIAGAASLNDVLWAAVHHVASTLQCRSLVLLPLEGGRLEIASGYPPEDQMSPTAWGAAQWAWQHDQAAGWGSGTLPAAEWLFLPLKTGRGPLGLLGVAFEAPKRQLTPEQRHLLEALVDQVAVAIERTSLATDIEQARLLTETERLRSALLSSVSHDLRTPLVSIIGSATGLASREVALSEADRAQLVQTILEESERLNRFVQNLLDMTRLGYGVLEPNRDWVDLREIVGRAVRQMARSLASLRIDTRIGDDVPILYVDPILIEQVLVNILDNAAKHSPHGGLIEIEAVHEAGRVVMKVGDDGPGIPPEERDTVFDLFHRVDAGDRQTAGTGLGLSICRGLVEAHGGRIEALPRLGGRGTTIAFWLPVQPVPAIASPDEDEHEPQEGKPAPMTSDGIARILVIDDESQIRKFLRISLNAYGYEVIEAVRGEDGIARCATESPDLVILDLGLPDLDGQEVIARIREWSKVPIIVLSVRAAEAEKVAALDHGADDYVTKPFGIHELLARVRAALRGRHQDGEPPAAIEVGDLTIDIPRRRVRLAGAEIKLSRKEFALLRVLAQHAGRIVTHQHLLREVWGPAHEHETHYLRIYIGHLRQKLGDDPADPRYISNEPGVGYRLLDPEGP